MNGYVCFYKGKRTEVRAETTWEAQQKAAKVFKAKSLRYFCRTRRKRRMPSNA